MKERGDRLRGLLREEKRGTGKEEMIPFHCDQGGMRSCRKKQPNPARNAQDDSTPPANLGEDRGGSCGHQVYKKQDGK